MAEPGKRKDVWIGLIAVSVASVVVWPLLRRLLGPAGLSPWERLRQRIMGRSKAAVAARFGPPRSAAYDRAPMTGGGIPPYWQAHTWYYVVDPKQKVGMAVRFARGYAQRVEFIGSLSE